MASGNDAHLVPTPNGVRVDLGKLYVYPDGHANLVLPPNAEAGVAKINMPLTTGLDVVDELVKIVRKAYGEVVTKRPGQA
jgi:hypothetical protein